MSQVKDEKDYIFFDEKGFITDITKKVYLRAFSSY